MISDFSCELVDTHFLSLCYTHFGLIMNIIRVLRPIVICSLEVRNVA
jgi:hypothetical protein